MAGPRGSQPVEVVPSLNQTSSLQVDQLVTSGSYPAALIINGDDLNISGSNPWLTMAQGSSVNISSDAQAISIVADNLNVSGNGQLTNIKSSTSNISASDSLIVNFKSGDLTISGNNNIISTGIVNGNVTISGQSNNISGLKVTGKIIINNSSNTVNNCEIKNSDNGFEITSFDNIISNNKITNCSDSAIYSNSYKNKFYNNVINVCKTGMKLENSGLNIIIGNYFDEVLTSGIIMTGGYGSATTSSIISNNIFHKTNINKTSPGIISIYGSNHGIINVTDNLLAYDGSIQNGSAHFVWVENSSELYDLRIGGNNYSTKFETNAIKGMAHNYINPADAKGLNRFDFNSQVYAKDNWANR